LYLILGESPPRQGPEDLSTVLVGGHSLERKERRSGGEGRRSGGEKGKRWGKSIGLCFVPFTAAEREGVQNPTI